MAKKKEEIVRDDSALLDAIYSNLMKISDEIQNSSETNPKLVDSFDSLVSTYFDITTDGGF